MKKMICSVVAAATLGMGGYMAYDTAAVQPQQQEQQASNSDDCGDFCGGPAPRWTCWWTLDYGRWPWWQQECGWVR